MSTDWIKMRVDLRTHPKVVRMASALKADKLRVIGGLFAVWAIFDAHSSDGVLEGYTFRAIDDELGWKGFAAAMTNIDWLMADADGLRAPRFEEHNGQSAKRRAMETERKRLEREAERIAAEAAKEAEKAANDATKTATDAGQVSASDADKSVTREEKRRKEEIQGSGRAESAPRDSQVNVEGFTPTPAGSACRAMKQSGLQAVNPGDPRLLALLDQGATEAEFAGLAAEAVDKGKGFAWVLHVLQARRSEAASIALKPAIAAVVTATSTAAEDTQRMLRADAEHRAAAAREREARRARQAEGRQA